MEKHSFDGNILIVGFGSIGQGVLPLLLRHFDVPSERITIVTGDERGAEIAQEYDVRFDITPLTPDTYESIICSHIGRGDFLLNVSTDVSSPALIELCQKNDILYIDTVLDMWSDRYVDDRFLSHADRSLYALREKTLQLRNLPIDGPRPTAVLAHGANPGLVSHFVKKALLNIAADTGLSATEPIAREGWAQLARQLGIKVIHIAERDTQNSDIPKKLGEFVNTWSIEGFAWEGYHPPELGWGSHEKELPKDAHTHEFGCGSAIYIEKPGFATKVHSWTPTSKAQHAWVITHHEAISIADFLTVKEGNEVMYRPTVHYAYHPCDDAILSIHELMGNNGTIQNEVRLLNGDITPGGVDDLGVLLMGHKKGAYWYGSRLSIDEARRVIPHNNATGLQVTASIIGAMAWAMKHPKAGIVEAEELDHSFVLDIANPYLGEVFGTYTNWTPIEGREQGALFPEALDTEDPWQFSNFIVS